MWDSIKGKDWPEQVPKNKEEYQQLPQWIINEIDTVHCCSDQFEYKHQFIQPVIDIQQRIGNHHFCGPVPQLDIARDGHHFDIVSSHWVAATVGRQWQYPFWAS